MWESEIKGKRFIIIKDSPLSPQLGLNKSQAFFVQTSNNNFTAGASSHIRKSCKSVTEFHDLNSTLLIN